MPYFSASLNCQRCELLPTVDGEIVALDGEGQVSFNTGLRSAFYVFDLLIDAECDNLTLLIDGRYERGRNKLRDFGAVRRQIQMQCLYLVFIVAWHMPS